MKISILSLICCFLFIGMDAYSENTSIFSTQQSREITGVVVDENNEPVIGATILAVKTSIGTITDLDGRFSLSMPDNLNELQISYLGYNNQVVSVKGKTFVTVNLVPSNINLEEFVVIGYGAVKKKDLTGAVVSMKSEDILLAPTSNTMEALQGKISGMDIIKTGGQVGAGNVDMLLRGSRSIYGDNKPLFIIDGIPGSYDQVNPSDIQSVDVLKDASSTAIYGSAGANGVIIITTKRGKEGKVKVNFDAYYGFSGKPDFFHGMEGDEWTRYQREAYKYKNGQYPADMSSILTNADKLDAYNQNKWIDWVDEAAGNTAVNQKYNLSITGGTAKTRIFSSVSYENQEGLLSNEDYNRYAFRFNLDQEIRPWLLMGVSSNLTYSILNSGAKNTFTKSLSAFPLGDVYDENGNINYEYIDSEYTPLGDLISNQFVDNTRNTYVNPTAYVEFLPLKELSFKSIINASLNNSRRGQYWGAEATSNRPTYAGTPHASVLNSNAYGYTWDNILAYNKTFLEQHAATVTLISSWDERVTETELAAASGQFLDSWTFYRLKSGTGSNVESTYVQKQKMSYAARLNYSYAGKYLLAASVRRDGVSWLSSDKKWDTFPAASIGWRVSEESFMGSTKSWLDNLKLRIGYGITGNSGGVDAYATKTNAYAYSSAGISADGKIVPFTQYSGTYGNPNLGWEKSYNWNFGLDFSVLNGRINTTVEWFDTYTKGLLFKRTLPITSGATGWGAPLSTWENLAETSGKGLEIAVNTQNIRTKDFYWNSDITFTWSQDKIESLPTGDLISESLFVGEAIRALYDYKYKGIWGTNADQATLDAYGVKPGFVMVETIPVIDANGNSDDGIHKYSNKDMQVLGHKNPDFIIGFNNSFKYKDFDLNLFLMARYGQTIQSDLLGWYSAKYDNGKTNQISGADYWTEDNQGAYFPVPGSSDEQQTMAALKYRDGSFIKLKNVTVGYTLPKAILNQAKIEKLRFYVTAYNPYTYVKDKELKGTDPETNGSDSFPLYRQFVFGLNFTF